MNGSFYGCPIYTYTWRYSVYPPSGRCHEM